MHETGLCGKATNTNISKTKYFMVMEMEMVKRSRREIGEKEAERLKSNVERKQHSSNNQS